MYLFFFFFLSSYELIVVSTEEQLQVLRDQKRRSAEDVSGNSSDPFSGLLYRMMGIDSVIKV